MAQNPRDLKKREFFRVAGRAFGAVVGLAVGVGVVRSSKAKSPITWEKHQRFMNLRGVNGKMLAEIARQRNCLNGTGYIDHGDPLRFHTCGRK